MLTYKINPELNVGADGSENPSVKIDVPMRYNFSLDMHQEILSDEKFFAKIKSDVLPPITDMEKIVVYPAVYNGDNSDGTPMLFLADEMEFNLHFRRRWFFEKDTRNKVIKNGWVTTDRNFWTTEKDVSYSDDSYGKESDDIGFDERADLLGYLGFDDDDVYYQKAKVKKSFLRLMYYDSDDLLNKNLLTYSTSFLDSGKLFTDYARIKNNKDLYRLVMESEAFGNEMVMFEPGKGDPDKDEEGNKVYEKYDKYRISSKITLKDKYNDDASSDGFYIYIFKADAPSEIPMDLYLKAEFNNAKYGKTVNFILPVGEDGVPVRFMEKDGNGNRLFPLDFIRETGDTATTTNFDFTRYYKSLMVNVKMKYDRTLGKYVYYFPWDPQTQRNKMGDGEFTVSNDINRRKITLNFFEPKMNRI
jgi:hypothetical protein